MKKTIISIAIVLASIFSINANAQGTALEKGDNLISATVGFGSFSFSDISVPPISVSYEHIVCEFGNYWSIGAGAFGGILAQRGSYVNNVGGAICAQGDIHFCPSYNWDIYSGLGFGVALSSTYLNGSSATAAGFAWAFMLGARYFFGDTFGVNLQLGGLGICNIGVSFRF